MQHSCLLKLGFDGSHSINVDLQGPNINALSDVAMLAMPTINAAISGAQVRLIPNLQIAETDLRFVPNDLRIIATRRIASKARFAR